MDPGECEQRHVTRGLLFGVTAAVLSAVIWSKVCFIFGQQWGVLGIFFGFIVGMAVRAGSEGRRGAALPWIGAGLSGFAVYLGFVLLANDMAAHHPDLGGVPAWFRAPILTLVMLIGMGPGGWLLTLMNMWTGWRMAPHWRSSPAPTKELLLKSIPEQLEFGQAYPDQFPLLDRKGLQDLTDQLQELGFDWHSDYRLVDQEPGRPKGMARLFIHKEQRCYAEVGQAFPPMRSPIGPWVSVLSALDDGWRLSTSNLGAADGVTWLLRQPRGLWSRHPGKTPEELFREHISKRLTVAAALGVGVPEVSADAYFKQQSVQNQALRATVAGLGEDAVRRGHEEGVQRRATEWWGDYPGWAAYRAAHPEHSA